MSRISELEFYNDKDVITQIEWLKNNIKADHIESVQVVQNGDKTSDDYGLTTVKITMENGHEYKGEVISAILKDVRIQSGEDFNVMIFELANGETISTNIPLGSDSYWSKIKGEPQSNTALKAWMDEKAEAVDLTNETNLRVRGDEALGQRITDLDRDVAGEIERIDGELEGKAEKSALEEETTKRTEADTGLLQTITAEETARKNAIDTLTDTVQTKEDRSNKVNEWQAVPDHQHYPTEKLVKDALITEENARQDNVMTLLELIRNTENIVGATQVDYKLLDDGIEQIRIILASAATAATVTEATVLYIFNINKYFENYNYASYRVYPVAAPFNQETLPASILPKNFTSYNGVKCVFKKESGQWLLAREDGQNIGTDRYTLTFMFKTTSKKV